MPAHNRPQQFEGVSHAFTPQQQSALPWTHLEEDDDGTDEHADALEEIPDHVDEGCSHAGVGLLAPAS